MPDFGYTSGVNSRLPTCLLCALIVSAWGLWWQLDSLSDLITYRLEQRPMQTITETVTCSDGTTVVVVTTRLDGESDAAFVKRHRDLVAELKK